MSRLLIIRGAQTGVAYDLGERTRIGRLGENEIQVPDPNVSRLHAEIVQDVEDYVIFDRGSKNGVLINGQEIAEKKLLPGDEIVIGGSAFVFDPDFNLKNSRFSDNSVYFVKPAKDIAEADSLIVLDARKASESKVPALVLAEIFGSEICGLPTLTERIASGIKAFFQADHVILLLKDHQDSDLQPFEALPYGESVAVNRDILAKCLEERSAISTVQSIGPVPGLDDSYESIGEKPNSRAVTFGDVKSNGSTPHGPAIYPACATMCAPIIYQGHVMGVLVVDKETQRPFDEQALETLQGMALLASYWLQAARVIERSTGIGLGDQPDADQRWASTRSLRMQEIYNSAKRSADGAGTILITGEYGTGKETLARYVHESGTRASGPFVVVNCASIPPEQFEQVLFGYEKGAIEGAEATVLGKVEEAQGGTLFFNEIGELELSLQPKLLRFLQDRAFYRLGGHRALETDLRIIAATTVDLATAVRSGKFREDLWYRLNVVPFHMPPVRERREDIGPLVDFFVARHSARLNKKVLGANDGAISLLQKYDWPGNIRELENAIERAVLLCESKVLSTSDFSHIEEARRKLNSQADLERKRDTKPLAEVERQHIMIALKKHNFNQARAAEALGLHRNTLRNKIIEYGIEIAK